MNDQSDGNGIIRQLVILLKMFRQSQLTCDCSIFPQPVLSLAPFRSPQRLASNHTQPKKSLKFHSSSRHKPSQKQKLSIAPIKMAQRNGQESSRPPIHVNIGKKSEMSRHNVHGIRSNIENIIAHQYQIYEQPKLSHRNLFEIDSHSTLFNYQASTRAASPLNPYDSNTQRVAFKYANQQAQQPHFISPPKLHINEETKVNSTESSIAASYLPAHSQLFKKFIEPRPNWVRQSLHQPQLIRPAQLRSDTSSVQSRPQTSNIIQLSRLSEMMDQKQEIESIYEGQRTHRDDLEYSRVLISCRKLMQERNGVLMESGQHKLFNFEERQIAAQMERSSVFDQIRIGRK